MDEFLQLVGSTFEWLRAHVSKGTFFLAALPLTYALYQVWRLRRVRGLRKTTQELVRTVARDIPGVKTLFARDGTASDELRAFHESMIENEAATILQEARHRGNQSLIHKDVLALQQAATDLSPAQILSLADKPETLLQVYLNTVRVSLGDDGTFERVRPRLSRMFTALLENPGYLAAIARFKPLTNDAGFSIDVNMSTHQRSREEFDATSAVNLNYDLRSDEFVGRQDLIDKLVDSFLETSHKIEDSAPFRWTLIYGGAGSGKSRFAVELLRDDRVGQHFNVLGIVSQNGVSHQRRLNAENASRWQNNGHTFFVLDYAGHQDDLAEVILTLDNRAKETGKKIRLLLLERRNEGVWANAIRGSGGGNSNLRETRYEIDGDLDGPIGHELRTTDDQHLGAISVAKVIEITKRRIRAKRALGAHETPDVLRHEIWALDPLLRPLFAAVVGSQLAEQSALAEEQAKSGTSREERTEVILRDIVNRERRRFWLRPGDQENDRASIAHETLLALSTMCRGVPTSILSDWNESAGLLLPNVESFDRGRYARMVSNPGDLVASRGVLGFLTPDFFGEWFVLDTLVSEDVSFDQQVFLDTAWSQAADRVPTFLFQCYQNHPSRVAELGFLLPALPRLKKEAIELLVRLLTETAAFAEQVWTETDGSDDKLADVVSHLDQIFAALRQQVVASNEVLEPEVLEKIAKAAASYTHALAFFVSPTRRDQQDRTDTNDAPGLDPQALFISHRLIKGFRFDLSDRFRGSAEQPGNIKTTAAFREFLDEMLLRTVPATPGTPVLVVAIRLLESAALLFDEMARESSYKSEQLLKPAGVFREMAAILRADPSGYLVSGEPTNIELAAQLLKDAAKLFDGLAQDGDDSSEIMEDASEVFTIISGSLIESPHIVYQGSLDAGASDLVAESANIDGTSAEISLSPLALLKVISETSEWLEEIVNPPWLEAASGKGDVATPPGVVGQFADGELTWGGRMPSDRSVAPDEAIAHLVDCWRYAVEAAADNGMDSRARNQTRRILDPLGAVPSKISGLANTELALASLARRYARLLAKRAFDMAGEQKSFDEDRERAVKLARLAANLSRRWAPAAVQQAMEDVSDEALIMRARNLGMAAYALRGIEKTEQLTILHDLAGLAKVLPGEPEIVDAVSFAVEGLVGSDKLRTLGNLDLHNVIPEAELLQIWRLAMEVFPEEPRGQTPRSLLGMLGALGRLAAALPDGYRIDTVMRMERVLSELGLEAATHQNAGWATHVATTSIAMLSNSDALAVASAARRLLVKLLSNSNVSDVGLSSAYGSIAAFDRMPAPLGEEWSRVIERIFKAIDSAVTEKNKDLALTFAIGARAALERWEEAGVAALWHAVHEASDAQKIFWLTSLDRRGQVSRMIQSGHTLHLEGILRLYAAVAKRADTTELTLWQDAVLSLFLEPFAAGQLDLLSDMLERLRAETRLPKQVWLRGVLIAATGAASSRPDLVQYWSSEMLTIRPEEYTEVDMRDAASSTASALAVECISAGLSEAEELQSWLESLAQAHIQFEEVAE